MTARLRAIAAISLLALLVVQLPVQATRREAPSAAPGSSFDTPAPTPAADPPAEQRPKNRKKKGRKAREPGASPADLMAPPAGALTPLRTSLTVGMPAEALGQTPLIVADEAGYFGDAGFSDVDLSVPDDPLGALLAGELDFAVLDARAASQANVSDPTLKAIAGYRNYGGADGAFGGDLLMAAPGLVADEPGTVTAFLTAYLRVLGRIDTDKEATRTMAQILGGGAAIDEEQAAIWPDVAAGFAPFDGGFGSVRDEGGWGELSSYLVTAQGDEPDLNSLVAQHTLNISQAALGRASNPMSQLQEPPGIREITIGLPATSGITSPIVSAAEAGYLEEVGFADVRIVDVQQPLLGLLQGELDLAVIDAVDAADGASQGLPLTVLAGHRNGAPDGSYGGDVLTVSADLLSQEPSTVSAFLMAYVRALQDLSTADPEATDSAQGGPDLAFAPFDGGFGDRELGGGIAELEQYLEEELATDVDLEAFVDSRPLQGSQAWWGLPANPIPLESRMTPQSAPSEDSDA